MRSCIFLLLLPMVVQSFMPQSKSSTRSSRSTATATSKTRIHATKPEKNFLMDDFRTADRQIINPYQTLKIDRTASRLEIRNSYRKLSKKYHPDAVRFRTIMPGKCDTFDDVRDEWERIKLSYEILSDHKLRKKYDRQSALNEPGKALGRAAFNTVSWGVSGLAKGVFDIGKQAVSAATTAATKKKGVEKEEEEGLVKIERRRRKERMVQHIEPESSKSSPTSANNNRRNRSFQFDMTPKLTRRQQQKQQHHQTLVTTSGYPSQAIVGYYNTNNDKSLSQIGAELFTMGATFMTQTFGISNEQQVSSSVSSVASASSSSSLSFDEHIQNVLEFTNDLKIPSITLPWLEDVQVQVDLQTQAEQATSNVLENLTKGFYHLIEML